MFVYIRYTVISLNGTLLSFKLQQWEREERERKGQKQLPTSQGSLSETIICKDKLHTNG